MRRKSVAVKRAKEDTGQPRTHQDKNASPAMLAKALCQCDCSEHRDPHSHPSVEALFGRHEVSKYSRQREQHWRSQTMHDTQRGGPHTKPVRGNAANTLSHVHIGSPDRQIKKIRWLY